jgi:hypothetical protein
VTTMRVTDPVPLPKGIGVRGDGTAQRKSKVFSVRGGDWDLGFWSRGSRLCRLDSEAETVSP